jgi:predicted secreted protein with PEFG-CTERM motif
MSNPDMNLFYANNVNANGEVSTSFYQWNKSIDDVTYDNSGVVSFSEPTVLIDNSMEITFTMVWNEVMAESEVMYQVFDARHNAYRDTLPLTIETIESDGTVTPEDVTPEDVTPEDVTPEDVTPEDVTPEDVTPEELVGDVISPLSEVEELVSYTITGGTVQSIIPNVDSNSLIISLDATDDGMITLTLPREVIDSKFSDNGDDSFFILLDGEEVLFDETINESDRIITLSFVAGSEQIEIIGTFVIPEFGTIAAMILAVAIISIIAISAKSRLSIPRI